MLGKREPHIYGTATLSDVEAMCRQRAKTHDLGVTFFQSNSEAEIIELIQDAVDRASGLIINPAAFTHTSVAILDALKMLTCPIVEVHISNPHRREPFRHRSYVSQVANGVICGLGISGYSIAVDAMAKLIEDTSSK